MVVTIALLSYFGIDIFSLFHLSLLVVCLFVLSIVYCLHVIQLAICVVLLMHNLWYLLLVVHIVLRQILF